MNTYSANLYVPLIAAGLYVLLLISPFTRRGHHENQARWLLALVAGAVAWEFSIYLAVGGIFPNFALKALLFNGALIGLLTSEYLEWEPTYRLRVLGGLALLASLILDVLAPTRAFLLPGGALLPITNGTLTSYMAWVGFNGFVLSRTWRLYKETRLPWHANRLLFWFMALSVVLLGELLQFIDLLPLVIIGQLLRLLGVAGLAYGMVRFRIFDVRTRARRTLAFLIINTLSALPLILAILAVLRFNEAIATIPELITSLVIALIVTLGFFLYQPYRQLLERVTYRYLRGEGVNPNQVVRNYSQAIARTLDVQQLSVLIVGTLSELLEANRGALMLVTKLEDGDYEAEPIPAMGRIPRDKVRFAHDALFISQLAEHHQPLLQYDLDFNPAYRDLSGDEKNWLREMAMEVFVPVSGGEELVGLIAIGPKNTAVPYQPGELELVQTLADQTVVALQNARLYSEMGAQNEHIRHLNIDLVDQNERLEIMDQVKSDFITIASHELRTPLTQVKGYADILSAMNEENALTREQTREIVGHINRATLQLESLITAMLDASQLDVDGMRLTFVKTRLDTILRLAVEPLIQALRERRISLYMEGIDELPPLHADFKRMVQSFANLLGNAVKYTPDNGRIQVTAKLVPSQMQADEFLEIVISDTGIGIDGRFHELIFEKFFRIGDPQLHSTGSTKFKGAGPGLGLPIAKGVIEAHGGRIWVESEGEDEERLPGSRFHIILPVHPPGADAEADPDLASYPVYLPG